MHELISLVEMDEDTLTGLMERYSLEQFIRGFSELEVLKVNSDYMNVWTLLWMSFEDQGLALNEWMETVALPIYYQKPAIMLEAAAVYDYNREGIVAFKYEPSDECKRRLEFFAGARKRLTVMVFAHD